MTKRIKIFLLVISFALISFGIFRTVSFFITESKQMISQNKNALDYMMPPTSILPAEDSSVLNIKYFSKLSVIGVLQNKIKSPIAVLSYDSSYSLVIYKLPVVSNQNLNEIISFKKQNADVSDSYSYGTIETGIPYSLRYVIYDSTKYSKILLTCNTKTLSNSTINSNLILYKVVLGNFSIRYSNKPVDILLTKSENIFKAQSSITIDVALLKKNNEVFLFVLSSKDNNIPVEAGTLFNLISVK